MHYFWRLVLGSIIGFGTSPRVWAQSWSPLLPLNVAKELPFVSEALRDPEVESRRLSDDIYAQRALEEKAALLKELEIAKPARRVEIMGDLYKSEAILAAFYEDILGGRLTIQGSYGNVSQELQKSRIAINRYAVEFARGSKDKSAQAHAFYHAAVAQYLTGQNTSADLLQRARKKLPRTLQNRINYLIALNQGRRLDKTAQRDFQTSIKGLSKLGRISAFLYLARLEAARSQVTYINRLNQAVRDSNGLSESDRERVAGYALVIWQGKEGSRAQWAKAPINARQNQDLDLTKAVMERSVLQSTRQGNYASAIRFYQSMIDSSRGKARLVALVDRNLDLEAAQYRSSRNPAAYEKALIKSQRLLSSDGILGQGREQDAKTALTQVQSRHRQLVAKLISSSKQPTASKTERLASIRVAYNYLNGFAADSDKIPLKSEIAKLYVLNQQHAEAVKVYVQLKSETKGEQSQQFLLLAMRSQRILAQWPEKAPWQGMSVAQGGSRTVLAAMYEERLNSSNNWEDRAHLGLLFINLGQTSKGFALWMQGFEKDSQNPQAQMASGMMLSTFKQAREWQKLEDLSRFAIKARMSPIYRNQRLNAQSLLADALFEGGKEHFGATRYAEASSKLDEFTRLFKADKRRPEGMFVLAKSYHMESKHPKSVETMYAQVTEYPGNAFEHDALLLGGTWSKPMAWEDQTIFFYQRFADRYASDAKTPPIRSALVDLYMGRELFGNAVRAHAAQAKDPQVPRDEQIKSALAVMHIEERYGEAKSAAWGAALAKELSQNNPLVVAEVLAFEARQASARNDLPKIIAIESQLAGLNLSDRNLLEALALTRLILAEKQAEQTKQDIFNLEQKDPYLTLNAQYAIFLKVKAAYEKVCAPGPSSYCGLAMLRLSEGTRESLASIENLTIPETLDAATVGKFEKQKLGIISAISQTSSKADAVALGISERGETIPSWSQEIIVNSSEGSLSRSHGAIGNGYVQWMPVKAGAAD